MKRDDTQTTSFCSTGGTGGIGGIGETAVCETGETSGILGVNVDHVATLRQSRGESYPNPLDFARLIIPLGLANITMHLREDRRHIQNKDVEAFLDQKLAPLNLEVGCEESVLKLALKWCPNSVCVVPEGRMELTTEGGLNLLSLNPTTQSMMQDIAQQSKIYAFIEPDFLQIDQAKSLNFHGIELHTGTFCRLYLSQDQGWQQELEKLQKASVYAHNIGLHVDAGHGLTYETTDILLQHCVFETLNIGHFLIAMALYDGAVQAVNSMLKVIQRHHL